MTDPRETLARIRKQADAALEGPWEARQESPTMSGSVWFLRRAGVPGIRMSVTEFQHGMDNAEFIAAARTDVPALLDALEKVLELHQPVTDGMGFTEDGYGGISPACSSCGTSDEYAVPYPCPTVTAITTALEATK